MAQDRACEGRRFPRDTRHVPGLVAEEPAEGRVQELPGRVCSIDKGVEFGIDRAQDVLFDRVGDHHRPEIFECLDRDVGTVARGDLGNRLGQPFFPFAKVGESTGSEPSCPIRKPSCPIREERPRRLFAP